MNIREYIDNPMGKGSSALIDRQLIVGDLTAKYNKLTSQKKIDITIYKVNNKNYLFHLTIPSQSDRGNDYDVVVEFYSEDKGIFSQNTFKNYQIRMFCNAPSFVYTYANAYKAQDLLVKQLTGKFDKEVFKKEPTTRNPYKIVNYETYLFFAIKYILDDNRYMNRDIVEKMAKVYNPITFKSKIRSQADVLLEIKKLNKKIKDKSKDSTKENKESKVKSTNKNTKGGINNITPKTKTTARKSSTNKIKKR